MLHGASFRGYTHYYDYEILAEKAEYDLFPIAATKVIASVICTQ